MLFLFPFISILILWTSAVEYKTTYCDGLIFHHVYFDREVIREQLGKPNNLVMHKFSGILFFSHTIRNDNGSVDFNINACHVEKKKCKEIKGVPGGYAVGYDPGNDDIYFGGHDGIYKYNFLTKTAEYFAEEGKSIWGIFVKRNFYYIEYPSQQLCVYQDDNFVQVAEAVGIEIDHFYISKQHDVYYSNKSAIYKVDRPTKDTVVLNDVIAVRQITEDAYGDIYFCANDGIYIEDKPYNKIKKICDIDDAYGVSFDEHDHVIYSDRNAIYRLLPSKYSEQCYHIMSMANQENPS